MAAHVTWVNEGSQQSRNAKHDVYIGLMYRKKESGCTILRP